MTDVLHVSGHNARSCSCFYFIFYFAHRLVLLCRGAGACSIVPSFPVIHLSQARRCGLICSPLFLSIHQQTTPPQPPPAPQHPSIPRITSVTPKTGQRQMDRDRKRKRQSDSHSSNIYICLHPSQGVIPLLPTEGLMQTRLM